MIEAGIITSRDYLTLGKMCGDNVTIVVMSGTHEACNGPGLANTSANFPDWTDGKEPTVAELQSFNSQRGGIILPRSVSIPAPTCGRPASRLATSLHPQTRPLTWPTVPPSSG